MELSMKKLHKITVSYSIKKRELYMNAITLFSGIGVDELYLRELGINTIVSNEIIDLRAKIYSHFFPSVKMVTGDINEEKVRKEIFKKTINKNIDLIIITPPCQGVSTVGKNKKMEDVLNDTRNHLIISALNVVDELMPSYVLIENVPRYSKMKFPIKKQLYSLEEILLMKYADIYNIEIDIIDAANFGVPQFRKRIFYRLYKKGLTWNLPQKDKKLVTLEESIGHLPSLESGEKSKIKNHWARKHPENQIIAMRHTETGMSAFDNKIYFPKKENGEQIKGFRNTYKRMRWDEPAPTVTMRNEIISSQQNVHPGRKLSECTWSDARVLTLRELLIVSSMPPDLDPPNFVSETKFRQLIGEGVPPLLIKKFLKGIL